MIRGLLAFVGRADDDVQRAAGVAPDPAIEQQRLRGVASAPPATPRVVDDVDAVPDEGLVVGAAGVRAREVALRFRSHAAPLPRAPAEHGAPRSAAEHAPHDVAGVRVGAQVVAGHPGVEVGVGVRARVHLQGGQTDRLTRSAMAGPMVAGRRPGQVGLLDLVDAERAPDQVVGRNRRRGGRLDPLHAVEAGERLERTLRHAHVEHALGKGLRRVPA